MDDVRKKKIHNTIQKQKHILIWMVSFFIILLLLLLFLILEKPVIRLNGSKLVKINMNENYEEAGVTVTNLLGTPNENVLVTGKVDTKKAGTYKIKYQVKYVNSVVTTYRTVEVVDREKPKINLVGDEIVYIEEKKKYEELGYQAIDNNDGDITKQVEVKNNIDTNKIGTYQVKYQVSDKSDNKAEAIRTVIVVKKQDPNIKTIYLTFDDGPSSITPKILDILKKENVKATFFMIGKDNSYHDLIKRIKEEGHTVALHSNTHNYQQIYSSMDAYFNDLYTLRNQLEKITNEKASIIRFPGGGSNTVSNFNPGIMTMLTKEVAKRGFHYFDWNIDSGDTGRIGSDAIVNNVISALGNYHTYVVLMHDYYQNQQTVDALERIIHYGKTHGYKFDRITNNTPVVQHSVNN